jgi:glycosyltransferase involved in cell wall biosynthesis
LKILLVHNRYQLPGGEDQVYQRERELLRHYGHEVTEFVRDNREIGQYSPIRKVGLALRTTWAWDSYSHVREILRHTKPDVAHFHNTFPLISPAAYYACSAANVPVVQTLHNPRLLCPAATLFRDGKLCEDCVGRSFAMPAVRHACYQQSRAASAVVSAMLFAHRSVGTWTRRVDRYIVATDFYRQKFVSSGIPSEKIAVKPHFVDTDPGVTEQNENYALFVGRLAPEKGVITLLNAWKKVPSIPLRIRGEGPLAEAVSRASAQPGANITLLPRLTRAALFKLIGGATFVVWPSVGHYETFGLIAIEAFACGVPVVASRCGVMQEIVADGRTGLHFTAGDSDDLARKVEWAASHPDEIRKMGRSARAEYEQKYRAEQNYEVLSTIYQDVIRRVKSPLAHWQPSAAGR